MIDTKVEIEFSTYACWLGEFRVNGVEAKEEDFVEKYDHDEENAPDYGCGDMRCDIKRPRRETLDKYNINEDEYEVIANMIGVALDFGSCALCE